MPVRQQRKPPGLAVSDRRRPAKSPPQRSSIRSAHDELIIALRAMSVAVMQVGAGALHPQDRFDDGAGGARAPRIRKICEGKLGDQLVKRESPLAPVVDHQRDE